MERIAFMLLLVVLILGCKKENVKIEECGDINVSYNVLKSSFPKEKEFYLEKIEQIKGHEICYHLYRERKTKEVMPVFYVDGYYILGILIDKKGKILHVGGNR